MRDRIRQAFREVEREDKIQIAEQKNKLNEIIQKGTRVERFLSEDGWSVLCEMFTTIWTQTTIEIRRKEGADRDKAIAMQNALASLWNIIAGMQDGKKAAEHHLSFLAEETEHLFRREE